MKQIKKIIVSIIIGIMACLAYYSTANAYYVGESLNILFTTYRDDGNIYCVEHGQGLKTSNDYTIISNVKIKGNQSTDYMGNVQNSWYNAKLAYILSGDNGPVKTDGPVANSIWNNMYTWMSQVGQYHTGLYLGFASDKTGSPSPLDAESDNYANSLIDTTDQITDNTNKEKIKVSSYKKDDKFYIRVGPFNWTFPGNLTNVTVNDQDKKAISGVLYSSFNGNNEYWYGANEIQSGIDFYVSLPENMDITKITTIKAESSMNVKAVNLWFLEAKAGYKQNLIIREPSEELLEISNEFQYDIIVRRNLTIVKVNAKNEKIKLGGVGFYIQHKETGKYVREDSKGNITYVDYIDYTKEENKKKKGQTEFVTKSTGNNKGKITIKGLLPGTYVAYETKNPNYGYEIEGNPEIEIGANENHTWKIPNTQKYIKLSGYVWVDNQDGKTSVKNGLFKSPDKQPDGKDHLKDGITVRLKIKETGEIAKNRDGQKMVTQTAALNRYKDEGNNGHGEYLFEDVLIDNLADYYIEFEYDGLTYTNVIPKIKKDRGSKAAERQKEQKPEEITEFTRKELSREEFNKNFSQVEGTSKDTGITRDAEGKRKHSLSYEIKEEGTVAELINKGQYKIAATTEEGKYSIFNHFKDGIEEIKYINLGLTEREQPDIRLMQDVHNVRLEINNYGHNYIYNNRFDNMGKYGNGFDVGVKFAIGKDKYGRMSYTRAIYKADKDYTNEKNTDKELKVYVIYQIAMQNNSGNGLTVKVNNLVDYYDSNYEVVKVGTKLNEKGTIDDKNTLSYEVDKQYEKNGYKKVIINNETVIQPSKKNTSEESDELENQKSIFIEFALNRQAVTKLLDSGENLDNIAEVSSYSIYQNNKIYAGIDINSNPGNYVPGDEKYENDTDKAPGLKLELAAARQMTGKVFEDNVVPEKDQNADGIMTGKVRQGNGEYEDGEKGIGEVEVTLTEQKENEEVGKVYKTQTVKTSGKYGFIKDPNEENKFIPEIYDESKKDSYEYISDGELSEGDFLIKEYIPADYTLTYTWGGTTYTVQDYKGTLYDSTRKLDNKNWHKENQDTRKNDAMDNYDTNQESPKGSRIQIDEEIKQVTHNQANITRTKMDSTTPEMGTGIEKDDDGNIKYGTSTFTVTEGDSFTPENYVVKNIDFGIVERAKQEMSLNKRVGKLKATLANGNVIVDIDIDENGNVTGEKNSITYMKPSPNTEPSNGFVKLELDNELIQGTTLEVGYVITATNNSELDYLSEKFYHYGTIEGDIITMTPTSIIDYLDKDWSFNEANNPYWEIKTQEQLKAEDLVSAEVIGSDIGDKWILYTEKLSTEVLKPSDKAEVMLNVSKVLTTTDEISLDNETEIIKIDRPGGRKPEPIPGNYVPGKGSQEVDDSMAETTIVTPATGENQNYIIPVIVGTVALLTLGAGVVIIKKKVL